MRRNGTVGIGVSMKDKAHFRAQEFSQLPTPNSAPGDMSRLSSRLPRLDNAAAEQVHEEQRGKQAASGEGYR